MKNYILHNSSHYTSLIKNRYPMRLINCIILSLLTLAANAYDIENNGIYYNILSEEDATLEVTTCPDEYYYYDHILIPDNISYNGKIYTVTQIGQDVFYYSLITQITLPNSLKVIKDNAFNFCLLLESIKIPNSVTTIGIGAFGTCHNLKELVLPVNLDTIPASMCTDCFSLEEINIPKSVAYIGDRAFEYCSSLSSLEIPGSTLYIGDRAFQYCNALERLVVDPENPIYDSRDNCNAIIETKTNKLLQAINSTTIPETVAIIDSFAFQGTQIESLKIPASLRHIESYGLCDMEKLAYIEVDEAHNLYDSRDNCNAIIITGSNTLMFGCINTVIPTTVTSIYPGAFNGSGITSLTIPNNVKYIDVCAFEECKQLKTITLPEGLYKINYATFRDSGLEHIVIPQSVRTIDSHAFAFCRNLKSIVLPDKIKVLKEQVLANTSSLDSLVIPASVTKIESLALSNSKIKKLLVEATTPPICAEDAFESAGLMHYNGLNVSELQLNGVLYIPEGSYNEYASADVWKDFRTIVEFDPSQNNATNEVKGNENISIWANNNVIIINNLDPETLVRIYNTKGESIYCGYSNRVIVDTNGIYLVVAGNTCQKVIVRNI